MVGDDNDFDEEEYIIGIALGHGHSRETLIFTRKKDVVVVPSSSFSSSL